MPKPAPHKGPAAPRLAALGRYLRDAVYGATDGTVTTFAVVSGVEGAGLSPRIVLILGAANLVGDGFSMAAGNYLATKADRQRTASVSSGFPPEGGAPVAEGAPGAAPPGPLTAAGVTFATFAAAGAVPLLPYLLGGIAGGPAASVSAALTAGTFFGIGAAKALVVRTRWWRSGLESLAIGGAAAALAYLCGRLLSGVA
ncbi:VIT1/CCC1 transporter family protein [Alienimonas sp. DA493]|uniref:VIT1/CCC1 transporter family protein n=1 Tax=Alienimonas sp. DA493 TaxID=3373605 RepID=UPI0037547523